MEKRPRALFSLLISEKSEMLIRFGLKDRFVAAGIHLSISMVVAIAAAVFLFGVLYPSPFYEISGGLSLFKVLVGVDVVVGPLLTGLIFNCRKPAAELQRDLVIIVMLQLTALAYGLWSMYMARPVYLVHEVDRFVVVSAADIDPVDLEDAAPEFRYVPYFGILTLGLREPKDLEEKLKALGLSIAGKDLSLQPRFWQKLSSANQEAIQKSSRPLAELRAKSPEAKKTVDAWSQKQTEKISDLRYFPLVAREHFWTVVLDKELRMVGYLPIDPF